MKAILSALFPILLFSQLARAQHDFKPALHSINSIGVVQGSKGLAYTLQTVLGVSVKKSFAGVGVGIDDYSFRTVPLFLDLRQEFGKDMRNLFVYADGGYNLPWLTDKDKQMQQQQYFGNHKYRGGFYMDAGFGYNIHYSNKDVLIFSLGYSYKALHDKITNNGCGFGGCNVNGPTTYNYHLQRISLKAGYQF